MRRASPHRIYIKASTSRRTRKQSQLQLSFCSNHQSHSSLPGPGVMEPDLEIGWFMGMVRGPGADCCLITAGVWRRGIAWPGGYTATIPCSAMHATNDSFAHPHGNMKDKARFGVALAMSQRTPGNVRQSCKSPQSNLPKVFTKNKLSAQKIR